MIKFIINKIKEKKEERKYRKVGKLILEYVEATAKEQNLKPEYVLAEAILAMEENK